MIFRIVVKLSNSLLNLRTEDHVNYTSYRYHNVINDRSSKLAWLIVHLFIYRELEDPNFQPIRVPFFSPSRYLKCYYNYAFQISLHKLVFIHC